MTDTRDHPVELDGHAAVAVLDATGRDDSTGGFCWPLSAVALVLGVSGSDVVAELPESGPGGVDRVDVTEYRGEAEVRTYRDVRLGVLAAYTAAVAMLRPDSVIRRYFADRLTSAGGDAVEDAADAGDDRPLYLSDYLCDVTGDVDYAERYRSAFGKTVKAAYIEAHGTPPPVETVDVDGREAQVCQYTEADRSLVDEAWAGFRPRPPRI